VPGEERYEGAVCQGRRGMKERCARGEEQEACDVVWTGAYQHARGP
jgi:hypothetical protein